MIKFELCDNFGTEKLDYCYNKFLKSVYLLIMGLQFKAGISFPVVKLLCWSGVRMVIFEEIKEEKLQTPGAAM